MRFLALAWGLALMGVGCVGQLEPTAETGINHPPPQQDAGGDSGVRADGPARDSGADASIQLWWHADTPPPVDYSVSVFLLDESGQLRAQHDGSPANGSAPTSQWTPDRFVFDGHSLALPGSLAPGTYTVGVKLYTWWDGAVLPTTGGADYFTAGTITITK